MLDEDDVDDDELDEDAELLLALVATVEEPVALEVAFVVEPPEPELEGSLTNTVLPQAAEIAATLATTRFRRVSEGEGFTGRLPRFYGTAQPVATGSARLASSQ